MTAVTALLSSCGIYNRYKPVENVPEDLYGDNVTLTSDTTNFGNMNWREIFTDPYLQVLIEQGLENNVDYQSAQLQVEEAKATLLSAKCLSCLLLPWHLKER